MATAGFPALQIRPPESPLQELGGALQIKGAMQQQQLGEIQLQEARQNQTSQQVLMQKFSENNGDLNKTYADAAATGQVTPSMLLNFRTQSIAAQTAMANLSEKQVDLLIKQHDLTANELEGVKQLPIEQRPQGIKDALGRLANENVDISKIVPSLTNLPDFSDKSLNQVETGLKGSQWLAQNEKAQREQRQAPSDADVIAQRQASLQETEAKTLQATNEASLAAERQRQLGTVTAEDTYKEQQANYRATIQRQTTFANELQKGGLSNLDKMFSDPQHGYVQFLSQAQSTKNTIMQSKNGNELASNLEPLMLALGVTSFAGVHRINQTEVNAAGPEAGSLYRRLDSIMSKAGSGAVPEDTLKEAGAIVDGLIDAKYHGLVNGANMVAANAGLDPKKTVVMDRSGVITTLDKAQEGAAKPSQAATHRYNPTTGQIEEIKP
jgi:hypothetical protein